MKEDWPKRAPLLLCGLLCTLLLPGCSGRPGIQWRSPALLLSKRGKVAVFLRSGAEEPVILLSESGDYYGTVEVSGGSAYIGVWGEGASGSVSIQIE